MEIVQRLAANVRRLRLERGWSQEELADQSGLHRTYVSQIERGRKNATITVVEKLAVALGVTAGALLG
jgi:transcriptional regulator with XRE-family HTH domain